MTVLYVEDVNGASNIYGFSGKILIDLSRENNQVSENIVNKPLTDKTYPYSADQVDTHRVRRFIYLTKDIKYNFSISGYFKNDIYKGTNESTDSYTVTDSSKNFINLGVCAGMICKNDTTGFYYAISSVTEHSLTFDVSAWSQNDIYLIDDNAFVKKHRLEAITQSGKLVNFIWRNEPFYSENWVGYKYNQETVPDPFTPEMPKVVIDSLSFSDNYAQPMSKAITGSESVMKYNITMYPAYLFDEVTFE